MYILCIERNRNAPILTAYAIRAVGRVIVTVAYLEIVLEIDTENQIHYNV